MSLFGPTLAEMAWKIGFTAGQASGLPPGIMLGPLRRALFAAGDARADVEQALFFDALRAALGVGVVGIAAVDEDVAFVEQREERVDEVVDGRAGLDHHHDLPRLGEVGHEVFQRVAADELLAFGSAGDELVDLAGRAIVHGDVIAAAFDIERQVFAHHGEADEADIALLSHVAVQI